MLIGHQMLSLSGAIVILGTGVGTCMDTRTQKDLRLDLKMPVTLQYLDYIGHDAPRVVVTMMSVLVFVKQEYALR